MKKEEKRTTWKQQTIDKDTFDNNFLKAMDQISPCGNLFLLILFTCDYMIVVIVIYNYCKRWLPYFAYNTE